MFIVYTASWLKFLTLQEMEGKYSVEMFKHLEKQNEVLMEAYRSMSHELHRLQRNSEERSSADVGEAESDTFRKQS
ncbi:hypothetical protein C5167_035459 [Papaver somniferum]|uniref:Uncharacterized protein n=1 Tax=Papaver somniferum TaxID=3469 RepID=A0A4Y7KJX9_PAPSO|nr:hypothetical protein C5167_035459 [Papaver somniferum]